MPGCPGEPTTAGKPRTRPRWDDRFAQLVTYREEGNDWPRHQNAGSEREHTLGVWIHTQRYTHRRGELDPAKFKLLNDAVPGWQTGRTGAAAPPVIIGAVPTGGRWSPPYSSKVAPSRDLAGARPVDRLKDDDPAPLLHVLESYRSL